MSLRAVVMGVGGEGWGEGCGTRTFSKLIKPEASERTFLAILKRFCFSQKKEIPKCLSASLNSSQMFSDAC